MTEGVSDPGVLLAIYKRSYPEAFEVHNYNLKSELDFVKTVENKHCICENYGKYLQNTLKTRLLRK